MPSQGEGQGETQGRGLAGFSLTLFLEYDAGKEIIRTEEDMILFQRERKIWVLRLEMPGVGRPLSNKLSQRSPR